MVTCWAPDCKHNSEREKCKFFTFPQEENERLRWKTLLRQDKEPGPGARICSCHFKDKMKKNGPEIFEHSQATLSPEKKKSKIRKEAASQTMEEHQSTSSLLPSSTSEEDNLNENMQPDPSVREAQYSFRYISHDERLVRLYTGFQSSTIFFALFNLMKNIPLNYYEGGKLVENVEKIDQLYMTLMKLRQNFLDLDIAFRFNVSEATATNIIITWIHALHEVLFKQLMAEIPSRCQNQSCLPDSLSSFKNCRVILEFSEVETTLPWKPVRTLETVESLYETRYTWRFLVGLAPNGVITYVSKLYPGLRSDKKVVDHCGIVEQLQPGDLVLTDEGLILQSLLPQENSSIQTQFTTESTPEVGILVTRGIRRMRRYKILDSIPHSLRNYGSTIVQLVGALTNLQPPLVQDDFSSDSEDEWE